MGESDHNLQIQKNFYQAIEEPPEESTRRRGCRCRLDGSVIKLIGATLCIAGAIATCTLRVTRKHPVVSYWYITPSNQPDMYGTICEDN